MKNDLLYAGWMKAMNCFLKSYIQKNSITD